MSEKILPSPGGFHETKPLHPGDVFGSWTVLEPAYQQAGQMYYWCQCACGRVKAVRKPNLLSGRSASCGKHRAPVQRKDPELRIEKKPIAPGTVFGAWTVLGHAPDRNGKTCYRCRCLCGSEKDIQKSNLVYGLSRSCGCRSKPKTT